MNRCLNRIVLAAGLTSAALLAPAASASADTVKIGSDLSHPMDLPGAVCTNCTTLQQSQVGGNSPLRLTSPANGVVISWAVRTGDPGARYTLRILRPNGGNSYLGAGTSQSPAAVPGTTTDSTIGYPAASLPIKQGDAIGLLTAGAATGLPQRVTSGINSNVIANEFTGAPPDGSTAAFTLDVQHELLLQATVQFCNVPTLKKLKTKAAKQELVAHDCTPKVKKSRVKKDKFRGKVVKQKTAAGTTAAPGSVVPIVIGIKK
jgi:hypothetical protein